MIRDPDNCRCRLRALFRRRSARREEWGPLCALDRPTARAVLGSTGCPSARK
jgi:hypothetical protein